MNHIRPVASGAPSPEDGAPGTDLADLLRRSGRGDEAAFALLYDATAARVFGLAVRVVRDPAQAEEVTQESFLEIWRTAGRFDRRAGQRDLLAAHDHPPQGGRPGPVGRGGEPPRHDVPTAQPAGRARLDRRGRRGLARGPPGPRRTRGPHRGAARGRRPRLPRRLHTHGGGDHARPTGRHRQDPDPRRHDPAPRRLGGGVMTDVHALSGAYAVDALDDIERAAFERHLAECADCRAEVASLRETAALLAETTAVEPPAALRDRVLADIATVRPLPPEAPAPEVRPSAPAAAPGRRCRRRARGCRWDRLAAALGRRHLPGSVRRGRRAHRVRRQRVVVGLPRRRLRDRDPLRVGRQGRDRDRRHAAAAGGQGLPALARPARRGHGVGRPDAGRRPTRRCCSTATPRPPRRRASPSSRRAARTQPTTEPIALFDVRGA